MRHDTLARALLAITAVFVAAAALFAFGTNRIAGDATAANAANAASAATDGASHFDARCGRCHDNRDITEWARAHPDARERGQWLANVLVSHGRSPAEERQAIIDHIQQVIAD